MLGLLRGGSFVAMKPTGERNGEDGRPSPAVTQHTDGDQREAQDSGQQERSPQVCDLLHYRR